MQRVWPVGAALAAFMLSCGGTRPFEPLPSGGHHVLFIGNSLTYANDLPSMVADLAGGSMSCFSRGRRRSR